MRYATEKQINYIELLQHETGASIFQIAREIGEYYTGDLSEMSTTGASAVIDALLEIKDEQQGTTTPRKEWIPTRTTPKKPRKTRKISEETAKKLVATLEVLDKDARKILAENTTVSEYNYLVNSQTRNTCVSKMMEKHAIEILALFEKE